MLKFEYLTDGQVCRVLDTFAAVNEPSLPITSEITALTGITTEMVAGQRIGPSAVASFISDTAVVIAHNAGFDRKFAERYWTEFRNLPWACSATEVKWCQLGFDGARLVHLLAAVGMFHDAHRAVDDCRALLEVLAFHPGDQAKPVLGTLLAAARRKTIRIWAKDAPFELKDTLKRRKYRWNDGTD